MSSQHRGLPAGRRIPDTSPWHRAPAVTIDPPSGLKAAVSTWPDCSSVATGRPVSRRQREVFPSAVASRTSFPSGLKATAWTGPVCRPTTSLLDLPGAVHTRAVPSAPTVTISLPSALKAASSTVPVCPWRSSTCAPVTASQTRAVPSSEAVTMSLPVRAVGGASDRPVVSSEEKEPLSGSRFPDLRERVLAGRHDRSPVGAERHAQHGPPAGNVRSSRRGGPCSRRSPSRRHPPPRSASPSGLNAAG